MIQPNMTSDLMIQVVAAVIPWALQQEIARIGNGNAAYESAADIAWAAAIAVAAKGAELGEVVVDTH